MAIEKRAVYKTSSGLILNVITVDTEKLPVLADGLDLLTEARSTGANIGDTWDGNAIVKGVVTPPSKWAVTSITQGNYLGNNKANRAIAHGLEIIPKTIFIQTITGKAFVSLGTTGAITPTSGVEGPAVTAADKTNFYVGNVADMAASANATGITYYWVAIS